MQLTGRFGLPVAGPLVIRLRRLPLRPQGRPPLKAGEPTRVARRATPAQAAIPGKLEFPAGPRRWPEVFEWLAVQTGMPVTCNSMPTGTFTFTGPAGARYTADEVVAILNRELLQGERFLAAGNGRFLLLWVGDEVPQAPKVVTRGSPGCPREVRRGRRPPAGPLPPAALDRAAAGVV